jgi:hypothetical protein
MASGEKTKYIRNPYWAYGEIHGLCLEAMVSERALMMVLHRRRQTSYPIALKLARATKTMGREIDSQTWLDNLGSKHPAFSGDPVKTSRRPEHCFVNIDKKVEINSEGSV